MITKKDSAKLSFNPEAKFDDTLFQEMYPTLHDYLAQSKWEDDTPRHTSTLLLFVDAGALKAVINDRHNDRSAFFNAATFTGLLDAIESALASDSADWKRKSQAKTGNGYTPF